VLTLVLLLALHAVPEGGQSRGAATSTAVDPAIERCPAFRDETGPIKIDQCLFLESGELAILDGDRYLYGRYCIDVTALPVPRCDIGRGNQAAAVFVRRRSETALRLVTTSYALGGQIRRPSIVANRYGHVLELSTILSATCDCNASRYFLKRPGSRRWREIDFQAWREELIPRVPEGLTNMDTPWPDLAKMQVTGALWQRADAHCCPAGGTFTGELAIEGNRFVLKTVQVTPSDGNPIRFNGRVAPEP
jgi:hypothetical protein